MATKFSGIYEKAIWKVRDFDGLVRTPQSSEAMYFHLLLSAIADVQPHTKIPLTFKEYPLSIVEEEEDETADPPDESGSRRRRRRRGVEPADDLIDDPDPEPDDDEPEPDEPEPDEEEEPEPEETIKDYIFDEELSLELQDLLALGVAVKWLEPHFLNSDALKKGMFNKDYKDFGLDADRIADIYHTLRRQFEGKAKTMSFRHSNFERLSAGRR